MRYAFNDLEGHPLEVLDYPSEELPEPSVQVENLLADFPTLVARGDIMGYEVLERGVTTVTVRHDRPDRTTFRGYNAVVKLDLEDGPQAWHVTIFPWRHLFMQLRGQHPSVNEARDAAELFVNQMLSARAARPPECP